MLVGRSPLRRLREAFGAESCRRQSSFPCLKLAGLSRPAVWSARAIWTPEGAAHTAGLCSRPSPSPFPMQGAYCEPWVTKGPWNPTDAQQNPEVGPRTPFLHSDCEPHRVAVAAQTTFSTSNCKSCTTCGVSSHQDPSLLECARFTHSLALLCSLLQVCAPCSVCRSVPSLLLLLQSRSQI